MRQETEGGAAVDKVAQPGGVVGEMEKRGPGQGGRVKLEDRGRYTFPCQEQGGWQRRACRPKL
jgi:hypothetical protein